MCRILMITAILLFTSGAFAKRDKPTCQGKEIRIRDCELRAGPYTLRLLADSISWNDSTWRKVDPIPLRGEGTSWEKINVQLNNGILVLQLWIWDKPVGENQVQSLNWYVTSIDQQKFSVLASGTVRKRRQKSQAPGAEGEEVKPKAPEFLYDGWETHGLKFLKDGRMEMTLGRHKQIL